jgi:hypothetical protein
MVILGDSVEQKENEVEQGQRWTEKCKDAFILN